MNRLVKFSGPPTDPGSWRPEIDPKHPGHIWIAPNAYRALIEVCGMPETLDEFMRALEAITASERRRIQSMLYWPSGKTVDSAIAGLVSFVHREC